jgi:hypothetical protein
VGGKGTMKRVIIMMLSLLMILGCNSSEHWPDKLYINGEKCEIPDVSFQDNDVYLPLLKVILALGGKNDGNIQGVYRKVRFQDKVFNYNIEKHVLSLETEQQTEPIVLLSEKSEARYLKMMDAQIYVDYTTLNSVLVIAGIDVQIRVDFENEKVFIDVDDKTNY